MRVCVQALCRVPSLLRTSSHTTTVETSTPSSSIMTHRRYAHTKHSLVLFYASCDVCMWCIGVIMSLKFEQQQVPSDGWPIILHFTLQHAKRLKQQHTHIVRERRNITGKMWGSSKTRKGGNIFLLFHISCKGQTQGQLMALLPDKVSVLSLSLLYASLPHSLSVLLLYSMRKLCSIWLSVSRLFCLKAPIYFKWSSFSFLRLGQKSISKRLSDGILFSNIPRPLCCWRRGVD